MYQKHCRTHSNSNLITLASRTYLGLWNRICTRHVFRGHMRPSSRGRISKAKMIWLTSRTAVFLELRRRYWPPWHIPEGYLPCMALKMVLVAALQLPLGDAGGITSGIIICLLAKQLPDLHIHIAWCCWGLLESVNSLFVGLCLCLRVFTLVENVGCVAFVFIYESDGHESTHPLSLIWFSCL